ncbi:MULTISPECIES: DNA topoisomerase III [Candidatus Ichthyocystis]|uniref:DNA topoisomerase n=1 Tax=Candidatus Ichthyocystis hellenicum TaxID=1561003 RepID=A0A0S4M0P1_9BURK|nr:MULTISPECIES: DNA topoisomerase III [Ichthyocystis]CUT17169.1 DNA topoisomerase III [Candidatus Ichthyocystis hellenicum]
MNTQNKTLIIAEKPSVAADIAKSLGDFEKHKDYYENDEYVISFSVGHLLELTVPEEFDIKKGKWSFAKLPVIPPYFELKEIEKTCDRLKALLKLIKRKDISEIVNACDAGREGELIFRYIIQFSKTKKPTKRLWLRSMTQSSIREGFKNLRNNEEMMGLNDAARCRAEADWLVGINGTRCMTAFNSREGGFLLVTIGRVQTPTLAMVVARENQIRKFESKPYWELHADFHIGKENYQAMWFDHNSNSKEKKPEEKHHRSTRLWDEEAAKKIHQDCISIGTGQIVDEQKPSKQSPPPLFDLTSLQREANRRFGLSAKSTLNVAQALYEKHKVITYPRTDAKALPEDYVNTAKSILKTIKSSPSLAEYKIFAEEIINNSWVNGKNKKVFDNERISDHFAIIPTTMAPKKLSEIEMKIFDAIMRRFLGVFFPTAEFLITTRITTVGPYKFVAEGKIITSPGWKVLYSVDKDGRTLPPAKANAIADLEDVEIKSLHTKPSPRFTEASLLSAMESAGKFVEDDEFREAMSKKGLGTPATRAAIIEGLIHEGYIIRQSKELIPTAKAFSIMTLLHGLDISELTSPELTGEWEHKLSLIEKTQLSRESFMKEIRDTTARIVSQAKNYESDTVPGDYVTLSTACPKCKGIIKENYRYFKCQGCDFSLPKALAGRLFEYNEVEELLEKKSLGTLTGFFSKQRRPFSAALKLDNEGNITFDFGQIDDQSEPIDFSDKQPLGRCPKCSGQIFELPYQYLCENALEKGEKRCPFKTPKVILQRDIEKDQIVKLLSFKETDLLDRFISKKGRAFSAHLVIKDDGLIGFKFQDNKGKGKAVAKKASNVKSTKPSSEKKPAKKSNPKTPAKKKKITGK